MNPFAIRKAGHHLQSTADWLRLAPPPDPEQEWAPGHAAWEFAASFFPADQPGPRVPADLEQLLASSASACGPVRLQSLIPEYLVRLDAEKGGSQRGNALASGMCREGRAAVFLHARTDEGFGPLIGDQLKRSRPGSVWVSRMTRLTEALLGRPLTDCSHLRSGLILLAAAALRAAEAEKSAVACLVFQEFRPHPSRPLQVKQQAADLDAFSASFGGPPLRNLMLAGPFRVPGGPEVPASVPLFLGKTTTLLRTAAPEARPAPGNQPETP